MSEIRASAGILGANGAGAAGSEMRETQPERANDEVRLRDFASVEASLPEVSWLWEGWLPRGLVTILASSPGEGKSALALEVARCVMGGATAWPDGQRCGTPARPGTVVLVDTEAAEAVLRGRVDGWGIPKDRLCVFATTGPVAGMARLALDDARDWHRLESSVTQAHPALVIVDSLSGAHRMDENSAGMRRLLLKLARLASDSRAAVLVVHHLRKRRRSEPDAASVERLRGSSTLAQLARCVWTIDRPDPNDPRRRLAQLKNNLVAFPPAIGFTIGPAGLAFTDAPAASRGTTQAAQAAELLETLLRDGPLPATEIWWQTEECGFSKRTVFQGSHLLGVVKTRRTPTGAWLWDLPGRTSELPW